MAAPLALSFILVEVIGKETRWSPNNKHHNMLEAFPRSGDVNIGEKEVQRPIGKFHGGLATRAPTLVWLKNGSQANI